MEWFKASYSSSNGACVEVAVPDSDTVLVRDSKNPDGGHMTVTREGFAAFVQAAKDGFPED